MVEDFKWQIATQRTVWFTCTHSPPVTFIPKVRSGDVQDEDQRNSHQTFLRLSQHTGTCTLAAVYCACWFLTKLSNEVTACVQCWRNMSAAIWRGKLHLSECWTRLGSSHVPSVNAVPHGGQMEGLWGKGRGLELYEEPCVLPVNALSHGGQMESLWGRRWGLELSVEPSIPPVNTLSHGGQIEGLWGKGRGLEFNAEPSIPPVKTVSHGSQMESLRGRRLGLELSTKPSTTRRFINQHWRGANGTLRSAKDTKAHPQNPATWQLHKDNLVLKPGNIRSQNLREEKDQFHLLFSATKCAISCPRSLLLARSWTAPGQAGISMAEYRLTETCHCAIADVFLSRLGTVSTWKFGPQSIPGKLTAVFMVSTPIHL